MEESSIDHSAPHTTALWPLSSLLTQPWPPSAWGPCSGTALALLLPLLPLLGLDLSWLPRRLLSLQEPDATTKRWGVTPVSPSPRVESTYQRAISKKARTCTSSPTGVQNQGQTDTKDVLHMLCWGREGCGTVWLVWATLQTGFAHCKSKRERKRNINWKQMFLSAQTPIPSLCVWEASSIISVLWTLIFPKLFHRYKSTYTFVNRLHIHTHTLYSILTPNGTICSFLLSVVHFKRTRCSGHSPVPVLTESRRRCRQSPKKTKNKNKKEKTNPHKWRYN